MAVGIIRNIGGKVPFKEAIPVIQSMTSNTSPSGYVASASSTYSNAYMPYFAFDGKEASGTSLGWNSASGNPVGQWLKIQLPSAVVVNRMVMQNVFTGSGIASAPKKFILQGSNDNTNFEDIQTFDNDNKKASENMQWEVSNNKPYSIYRIYVLESHASDEVGIGNLQLFKYVRDINSVKHLIKDGVPDTLIGTLVSTTNRISNYVSLTAKAPTIDYSNSKITLNMSSGSSGMVYSQNAIDVTDYRFIEVTFSVNGSETYWTDTVGLTATKKDNLSNDGALFHGGAAYSGYGTIAKHVYDITSFTGMKYLYFSLARTSTMEITEIKLIK